MSLSINQSAEITSLAQKEYKQNRLEELKKYNITCYPYFFETTTTFSKFIQTHQGLTNGETNKEYIESLVGRVVEIRKSGKNLYFYTVQSDCLKLQLIINRSFYDSSSNNENDDSSSFDIDTTIIKRGDMIGFFGYASRSKTGELSLLPKKLTLLAPCLKLLPKQHYGIVDREIRERKRYLDFIVNPDNMHVLFVRHKVYKCIRRFLDDLDFIEVQTPCLHPIVGGASAKPFITYHNDTKQNMYMRVAPELYLKQLIVGGASKVYEIGSQFRNESADLSHNPEFTSLEFYMAYSDYNKLFTLCEDLICSVVQQVTGSNIIKIKDKNNETIELNFTPSFVKLDIMNELEKEDIKFDLNDPNLINVLDEICKSRDVQCNAPRTVNRLLDKLIGRYVETKCIQPTFVINHPKCMSPLSKASKYNPALSERFELFVNGVELCNAYSELNDPDEQHDMFMTQMKDRGAGDDESQMLDHTYVDALHYGLPCTAGFGCGLDRLIMLLSGKTSIRDVIAFPTMKNLD